MTPTDTPRGLRISRAGSTLAGSTLLDDVSCGTCPACRAGRDYWCSAPLLTGTPLGTLRGDVAVDLVRRWTTVMCALLDAEVPQDDAVLVLTQEPSDEVVRLVAGVHDGLVLTSADGRDEHTRDVLASASPTGRAQVVIALRDARTAVRSVQRGGTVCLPDAPVDAPTVTELVQRDVRLLGPSSLAPLADRHAWPSLLSALDALLAAAAEHAGAGR